MLPDVATPDLLLAYVRIRSSVDPDGELSGNYSSHPQPAVVLLPPRLGGGRKAHRLQLT